MRTAVAALLVGIVVLVSAGALMRPASLACRVVALGVSVPWPCVTDGTPVIAPSTTASPHIDSSTPHEAAGNVGYLSEPVENSLSATTTSAAGTALAGVSSSVGANERGASHEDGPVATSAADDLLPAAITRLRVPRIRLDAEVVTAHLVNVAGGYTWEVPAHAVGHGEYTAGAGEIGNAVLIGHVTSLAAGSVFRDLQHVRLGDVVQLVAGSDTYDYAVVNIRTVPRTDLSVLQPTLSASVTLLTCTGAWLPALNDYAERLVIRAELVHALDAVHPGPIAN